MNNNLIFFEQPLNETMRLCLRLEYLFNQCQHYCDQPSESGLHLAIISLLKLMGVIDRPDLKSKITQALSQHATTLGQLQQFSQVNQTQLTYILTQLDDSLNFFHNHQEKIGKSLKANSFLNQIMSHVNNPAGLCHFATPAYALWRTKSLSQQLNDLSGWVQPLEPLKQAVNLIITLTRDSTDATPIEVIDGFYHQSIDPSLSTELIRIGINTSLMVYPEISAGKHHVSVRFLQTNDQGHALPYPHPIQCTLACCGL